eukprot:2243361-Prymnesium_polylepis.1
MKFKLNSNLRRSSQRAYSSMLRGVAMLKTVGAAAMHWSRPTIALTLNRIPDLCQSRWTTRIFLDISSVSGAGGAASPASPAEVRRAEAREA